MATLTQSMLSFRRKEPENNEFILVKKDLISNIVEKVACGDCLSRDLKVEYVQYHLDFCVVLTCQECHNRVFDNSPGSVKECEAKENLVTNLIIYTTMLLRIGYSGLQKLCAGLNITVISPKTYIRYVMKTNIKAMEQVRTVLMDGMKIILRVYADRVGRVPDENGVLDLDVTYKISYHNSRQMGVGLVIDAHTGLTLDFETISRHCVQCKKREGRHFSEEEKKQWKTEHQRFCTKTFNGSMVEMESEAAVRMWKRSADKNFRYSSCVSKEDTPTFDALSGMNNGSGPYGAKHKVRRLNYSIPFMHGIPQNPVEFLFVKIWSYYPIESSVDKWMMDFAASQAICDYNIGHFEKLVRALHFINANLEN